MRDNRVPLVLFGGTPGGGEGRRLGCGGGGTSSGGGGGIPGHWGGRTPHVVEKV